MKEKINKFLFSIFIVILLGLSIWFIDERTIREYTFHFNNEKECCGEINFKLNCFDGECFLKSYIIKNIQK